MQINSNVKSLSKLAKLPLTIDYACLYGIVFTLWNVPLYTATMQAL